MRGCQLLVSSFGSLPKFSRPLMPASRPARPAVLHLHEVRVARLIDLEAVDHVVAQAGVDRQLRGDAPVVLDVERVLIERNVRARVAVVQLDARDRAGQRVVLVRVLDDALAGVERDEQRRLVNPVHARLERVADAEHARLRTRRSRRGTATSSAASSAACSGSGRPRRRSGTSGACRCCAAGCCCRSRRTGR